MVILFFYVNRHIFKSTTFLSHNNNDYNNSEKHISGVGSSGDKYETIKKY